MTWPIAFALTQLLEMPVYWWGTRNSDLSPGMRLAVGFGASALTHPFVWFVFPVLMVYSYGLFFVVAESFAFIAEALYLRAFGVANPWRLALAANAFSATIGLLLQALW
jgi:hypothetical protein